MTCLESIPGLMTFKATRRLTGVPLLSDVHDPKTALPDLLQELVAAYRLSRLFECQTQFGPKALRRSGRIRLPSLTALAGR